MDLSAILASVTWASFEYRWIVGVVVLCGLSSLVWYFVRVRRIMRRLEGPCMKLFKYGSLYKKAFKLLLLGIGLIALAIACLRPQWGEQERPTQQEGRDLFVLLDISASMKTKDCFGESRLNYAKERIKSLIFELEQTRVGLILFADQAFVQCPLTFDRGAFALFLDAVDEQMVLNNTTKLASGLQLVLENYRNFPVDRTKLVLACTDGEDFSEHLVDLQRELAQHHVALFSLGVGTEKGGPIPLYDNQGKSLGYQKDVHDKVVISRLDSGSLYRLSNQLHGMYVGMQNPDEDVTRIVSLIHQQEKHLLETIEMYEKIDRHWIFVCVSFVALLLEWII